MLDYSDNWACCFSGQRSKPKLHSSPAGRLAIEWRRTSPFPETSEGTQKPSKSAPCLGGSMAVPGSHIRWLGVNPEVLEALGPMNPWRWGIRWNRKPTLIGPHGSRLIQKKKGKDSLLRRGNREHHLLVRSSAYLCGERVRAHKRAVIQSLGKLGLLCYMDW